MNKHTKGPWKFKQEGYFKYIGSIEPSGIWFGGRSSIENDEHLANIALVVAAPDLLETLEELLNGTFPDGWEDDYSGRIGFTKEAKQRCEKAKLAIAKARGMS